ncbi:MAG: Malate synthase, partial [uncultured Frankineae bacterium]
EQCPPGPRRRGPRRVARGVRAGADRAVARPAGPTAARVRPAPRRAAAQARRARRRAGRRRPARLPARDEGRPRGRLDGRAARAGPGRPTGRDHRPDRPQDGHQRAELRRQGLHGRLRGQQHADLRQPRERPAEPARRLAAADRLHLRAGQVVRPERHGRHPRRAQPRLAPARAARPRGRRAGLRQPVRLLHVHDHQRPDRPRQGLRALLLPAQDGEPPRGPALERRLRRRPGGARHPPRHHPRHVPDRDDRRGVRDGGDPLRAARALLRPQRRSLGLHLLDDQEVPDARRGVPAPRPLRGQDDGAVHARLHRAARQDLPLARRPRHRRHGRLHPQPQGRRGQRRGPQGGPGRQEPRGRRRLRRVVGRAPRPGAGRPGGLRRQAGRSAQPAGPPARRRAGHRGAAARGQADPRLDHRGRCAQQRQRRHPVPRVVAARRRCCGDLQPHGGRGHRRDQPLPDLAVGAQRRLHRRGHGHHPRVRPPGGGRGAREDQAGGRRRGLRERQVRRGAGAVRAGGARRRLRRVPDPARVRATGL